MLHRTERQIKQAKYMREKFQNNPDLREKNYLAVKARHEWIKKNDRLHWRVKQLAWLIDARRRSIELALARAERSEKELLRFVKERDTKLALLKARKKQERLRRKTVVNTGEVSQSAGA